MGRTVPSFRIAAEIERTKWKQFRSYLDKKDRDVDQMYDYVKLNNACRQCVQTCRNTRRPYVNNIRTLQAINWINGTTKDER